MIKVLITGSEGMLGRALMKSIKPDTAQIMGVDIKSSDCQLDITKADEAKGFIEKTCPDIIIHTAAYTDVDGCEKTPETAYLVNSEGTKNIAQAAKNTGAFLIYISTDYVFDGKKKTPYTEKDEPCPISVYGKSKLLGEKAIKDMLDNYLIIRTSWLFGKGGKNFVDTIIEQAGSEKILKVVDDQKGCPTYTEDLADAISRLSLRGAERRSNQKSISHLMIASPFGARNDMPRIINITNTGSCSWFEFAREIIKLKGIKNIEVEPASSDYIKRPAKRPGMSVLDNSEYIKLTGKVLPGWQDALRRYQGK